MPIRLIFAALLLLPAGASAAELALRSEVSLHGPVLRLEDVLTDHARAQIAASRLRAHLGVSLLTLGFDAKPFALSGADIDQAMRRVVPGGLGLWRLMGRVDVRPQVSTMNAEHLRQMLALVEATWQDGCAKALGTECLARATLSSDALPRLPEGRIQFETRAQNRPFDTTGFAQVTVLIRVDGLPVGRIAVPLAWEANRTVAQLKRPLEAGQAIRRSDFEPTRAAPQLVEQGALTYDAHTGLLRATRALAAGALVSAVDPSYAAMFRRGDVVPVSVKLGRVALVRQGTAVQDGRAGSAAFVRLGDTAARVRIPGASTVKEQVE